MPKYASDQNQSRHRVWHIRSVPGRNVRQPPGMTSLSLAAVSSDNPVSGDEHIRLARASGRFGIGRVAQPKRIQRRSSTPRAATDLGNPGHRPCTVKKSALLVVSGLQGDIHLVRYDFDHVDSGKIRFARRGRGHSDQNRHTVLPATPRRWQKRREAEKPRATRRYARMLS